MIILDEENRTPKLNDAFNESTFENRDPFSHRNSRRTDRALDEIPEKKYKGLEVEILKPVLGGEILKPVLAGQKSPGMPEVRIKTVKPKAMPNLLMNNNEIADICLKIVSDSVKHEKKPADYGTIEPA